MTVVSLAWDITYACNFRCIHCYNMSGKPLRDELSLNEKMNVCSQILETNIMKVDMLGGEPLLSKDIFNVARFLKSNGIALGLITNGSIAKNCLEDIKENFSAVQISIDDFDEASNDSIRNQGAFKKSLETALALGEDVDLVISTVVTRLNKAHIPDMLDSVAAFGIKKIKLSKYLPTGRGLINREKLEISDGEFNEIKTRTDEKAKDLALKIEWEDPTLIMKSRLLPLERSWIGLTPNGYLLSNPFFPFAFGNTRLHKLGAYLDAARNWSVLGIDDLTKTPDDFYSFKKLYMLDLIDGKGHIEGFNCE